MNKSIRDIPKKKRGRPSTGGRREGVMVRLEPDQFEVLDAWAAKQTQPLTRPEAIRRLVEIGLQTMKPLAQTSAKESAKAKDWAGQAIDEMADPEATSDEKASRKRRLISGPREFREVRVDRAKAKAK